MREQGQSYRREASVIEGVGGRERRRKRRRIRSVNPKRRFDRSNVWYQKGSPDFMTTRLENAVIVFVDALWPDFGVFDFFSVIWRYRKA